MPADDDEDQPFELEIALGASKREDLIIFGSAAIALGLALLNEPISWLFVFISWGTVAYVVRREYKVFRFATGKTIRQYIKERKGS